MDKKTTKLGLIICGVVVVVLLVLYIVKSRQMSEMVEVFTEEKSVLIDEYQSLYTDFDSLQSNNEEMNLKLEEQRAKVAMLQEELKTVRATNARRIRELQAELGTLRSIMRSYIVQVDSLNKTNQKLSNENKRMRKEMNKARDEYAQLADEKETLATKIEIASRLEAKDISVQLLGAKDKIVRIAKKTNKIKVNYTIAKNAAVEVGMLTVYLRITRPDGQLLMHSKADKFAFEDSELNFSAKRDVEYGGEDATSYIVYTVDTGELMTGSYSLELFCNNNIIGRASFPIK